MGKLIQQQVKMLNMIYAGLFYDAGVKWDYTILVVQTPLCH